jgi:hypothetical protein
MGYEKYELQKVNCDEKKKVSETHTVKVTCGFPENGFWYANSDGRK